MPAAVDPSSRALQQVEQIGICDGRGQWQAVAALLDTGNEHLTCVDEQYAIGVGLWDPTGRSVTSSQTSTTTLRGIVPGAEATDVPVIHVKLRVGGVVFGPMRVALTQLESSRPVLLGMDVLEEMFSSGFHISR